ncbi:response regulator transcription factor [Kitasatospora sp. NPDC056076]|uniref:helix-turn-helix transcriptional regulator n=1 Tax=Kitasatospora sp. NPDC056076 TaxID=3345703 RepID=UPI0035DBE77B
MSQKDMTYLDDTSSAKTGSVQLSPIAVSIYGAALRRGRISEADQPELLEELRATPAEVELGLAVLRELRLLTPALDDPGALTPASPDSAAAELVTPIKQEIAGLEQLASDLESRVLSLKSLYFESRQRRNRREAVDVIDGTGRVRSVLGEAFRRCAVEVLGAHPGVISEQDIEGSLPEQLELLARGVRLRLLFQHPVRTSARRRELLERLTRAGGRIRTCEEIADRIVILDRETAFIPTCSGPDGAVVLREPSTVDFLYRSLEQAWSAALPFEPDGPGGPGGPGAPRRGIAGEEIKRAILRMLAAGAKDDLISRRLSISVRTCRRHIAEMMDELEVSSRFQAGVKAIEAGLIRCSTAPGDPASREAAC